MRAGSTRHRDVARRVQPAAAPWELPVLRTSWAGEELKQAMNRSAFRAAVSIPGPGEGTERYALPLPQQASSWKNDWSWRQSDWAR